MQAQNNIKPSSNCKILGYDSAFQALRVSDRNIQDVGLEGKIIVKRLAIEKQEAHKKPVLLMTYPPYVEHLTEDEIKTFYKTFGETLKRKFTDSTAYIVAPNVEILKHLGIRSSAQFELNNGRTDLNLMKYELLNENN